MQMSETVHLALAILSFRDESLRSTWIKDHFANPLPAASLPDTIFPIQEKIVWTFRLTGRLNKPTFCICRFTPNRLKTVDCSFSQSGSTKEGQQMKKIEWIYFCIYHLKINWHLNKRIFRNERLRQNFQIFFCMFRKKICWFILSMQDRSRILRTKVR